MSIPKLVCSHGAGVTELSGIKDFTPCTYYKLIYIDVAVKTTIKFYGLN